MTGILSFIILFTPFAFGTAHLWSETLLYLSILLMGLFYWLDAVDKGELVLRKGPLNVFFAVLVLAPLAQLLSNTTLYPHGTYAGLKAAVVYFIFFQVTANIMKNMSLLNATLFKITVVGFLLSTLGILQQMTDTNKVYWIKEFSSHQFYSAFIYNNHFACYTAVAVLVSVGALFAGMGRSPAAAKPYYSVRQALLSFLETLFARRALFTIFAIAVMVCALFFSQSRAGVFGLAAVFLFFAVSALLSRFSAKTLLVFITGAVGAYILLSWLGPEKIYERLNTAFYTSDAYSSRIVLYMDGWSMFLRHPFFGIGINAFPFVFPLFRSVPAVYYYDYLHNDGMQLLVETGFPVFLLAMAALAVFLFGFIRSPRIGFKNCEYYIKLSVLSAMVYLALHSLVDFVFHLNAILVLSVFLLAVAVSPAFAGPDSGAVKVRINSEGKNKRWLRTVAFALFALFSLILSKELIARSIMSLGPDAWRFKAAEYMDPGNDEIYFKEFRFYAGRLNSADGPGNGADYLRASRAIAMAKKANPMNKRYLISEGGMELDRGNYTYAETLFREAAIAEPQSPFPQIAYSYCLFRIALSPESGGSRGLLIKKALSYYRVAKKLANNANFGIYIRDESQYKLFLAVLKEEGIVLR